MSLIKKLGNFFENPKVYKFLALIILIVALYVEVIAPITGMWSPRQPTLLDAWKMRGR